MGISMFDFKQRVFTIVAILLLIAGLIIIIQPSALKTKLTSPTTGYAVADVADTVSGISAFEWVHISQFALYLFILGFVCVGVFQLASFSARLNDKEDARQTIVAYIKQAREQGFSHDQIKQRLQAEGWGDNELEKSLNRVS